MNEKKHSLTTDELIDELVEIENKTDVIYIDMVNVELFFASIKVKKFDFNDDGLIFKDGYNDLELFYENIKDIVYKEGEYESNIIIEYNGFGNIKINFDNKRGEIAYE